ncbi:MAG: hypothetical protein M3P51_06430 [Chloroflexota bacterium]|nr:hypothetical protein [Chloroflexota bacterium]
MEKVVVALVRSGHFCVNLGAWVRRAGYESIHVESRAGLMAVLHTSSPALVIVDLTREPGNLLELTGEAGSARLIAFGPPRMVEALRAAEAAGFHEVLPDIIFHRQVPQLLARNLPSDISDTLVPQHPFETRRETDPEQFGDDGPGTLRSLWRRIRK